MASYSRNLVSALMRHCSVIVFADKLPGDAVYFEDVRVYRCWRRGLFYPFQIFRKLLGKGLDVVHVQHEYFLFGDALSTVLFPFMLCLLKLLRKPVVVTLHGVIPISLINKQFLRDNVIKGYAFALKWGMLVLTRFIAFFANALIVHESFFKDILINEYHVTSSSICVIPQGIENQRDIIETDKAKEILGLKDKKVLLFFGYITGYKGVELLIENFSHLKGNNKFVLFIAGGEHPRLKYNSKYLDYLQWLKKRAREISDRIIFTGFVPEDKIPLYFSAADLIIFPYKIVMSSSGPMSLALSYRKPFLVLESYREIIQLEDMLISEGNLSQKVDLFFTSDKIQQKIRSYCEHIYIARVWKNIARKTFQLYEKITRCRNAQMLLD